MGKTIPLNLASELRDNSLKQKDK